MLLLCCPGCMFLSPLFDLHWSCCSLQSRFVQLSFRQPVTLFESTNIASGRFITSITAMTNFQPSLLHLRSTDNYDSYDSQSRAASYLFVAILTTSPFTAEIKEPINTTYGTISTSVSQLFIHPSNVIRKKSAQRTFDCSPLKKSKLDTGKNKEEGNLFSMIKVHEDGSSVCRTITKSGADLVEKHRRVGM